MINCLKPSISASLRLFFVLSLFLVGALVGSRQAHAYTSTRTVTITQKGQLIKINFANLPPAISNVTLTVDLYGDFSATSEYADIYADAAFLGTHFGGVDCNTTVTGSNASMRRTFSAPATAVNDNKALDVWVSLSSVVDVACTRRQVVVTISYTESPDLLMRSISVPDTPGVGTNLTVTYNVANESTRAAGRFVVSFYYKDNPDPTGALLLGTATIASLGANATTGNRTVSLTLPNSVTAGVRYIHYFVDSANAINEGIERNNRGSRSFNITGKPNLQALVLNRTPTSVFPGGQVTLTYRIYNAGTTRASVPFFIGFYFSTDATITTADTYLRAVTQNSLDARTYLPSATGTRSITVNIPANAPTGNYYLGIIVDYAGFISETTTADNARSTPITITAPQADLSMQSISVPNAVGAGSNVNVTFNVRNTGAGNSGRFLVNFYYGDSTSTTGTVSLGTYTINSLSKGGNTGNLTRTLVLPNNVLAGRRYIHYFIDYLDDVKESNESNNRSSTAFNITGNPDLRVVFLNRSASSAFAGSTITLTYRIYNAGASRLPRATVVGFYFSNDSNIQLTDTRIGQATVPILNATTFHPASGTLSVQVTIPANATAGSRYLGAYVNDQNPITESVTTNNTLSVPINIVAQKPDLLAVRLTSKDASPESGKAFQVDYEIRNLGNANIASYTVHIYFSKDTSFAAPDPLLASFTLTNLAPGGIAKGTRTVTIPKATAAGVGYIGMVLDPARQIAEADESNNVTLTFVNVRVDNDGDGVTGDRDCNDNDKTIYPGAKEICDGKDNNCNAQVDEGCPCVAGKSRSCYNVGAGCIQQPDGSFKCSGPCKTGSQICTAGAWGACTGVVGPQTEACNNKDDNCDGKIDESLTQACYTGPAGTKVLGVCQEGTQTCTAGKWGTCTGEIKPGTEICNDKDDDCDGSIDEQLIRNCYTGQAATRKKGECRDGIETCVQGTWGSCQGEILPATEICNNKDDNCDGSIDENITRSCYSGQNLTKGVGECKEGTQTCTAGNWGTCANEVTPQTETCNNKDDDCDGRIDNDTCQEPPKEPTRDASEPAAPEPSKPDEPVVELPVDSDCYVDGCPAGQICRKGQCVADPCDGVTCQADGFCRGGQCTTACGCLKCKDGEACQDGVCAKTPCAGACKQDEACDSNDKCVPDPCKQVTCGKGRVCVEGNCQDDPCNNVKCPSGMSCKDGQCLGDSCSEQPSEPKVEPKSEPMTEPKAEPKTEPVVESKADSGSETVTVDKISTPPEQGTQDKTITRPADGCACSASSEMPASFFLLSLLFVSGLIRRRRENR